MNNTAVRIAAEPTVGEVMTMAMVTLQMDDTLRLADDKTNLARVRHFPVMHGSHAAVIVDQVDLLHASMASLHGRAQYRMFAGRPSNVASDASAAVEPKPESANR